MKTVAYGIFLLTLFSSLTALGVETRKIDIEVTEEFRDPNNLIPEGVREGRYYLHAYEGKQRSMEDTKRKIMEIIQLGNTSDITSNTVKDMPLNLGKITRYKQSINDIPIWNAEIVVEEDSVGFLKGVSGSATFDIEDKDIKSTTAKLSKEQALKEAKEKFKEDVGLNNNQLLDYENEESNLVYYEKEGELNLAYHVTFFTHSRSEDGDIVPARPVYIVDANTSIVLYSFDNLQYANFAGGSGGNNKTGRYEYGKNGLSKFDVVREGDNCIMDSANVMTENMNHKFQGTGKPWKFTCDTNTEKEINGAYSPLNDAHYFGKIVFDMYNAWYGVSPLGEKLHLRVHYGSKFENANWNGRQMSFGDGHNKFYPLVSLDVTAHEVSHGFTEKNSGLLYVNQSGGMNEAFSDMSGEAVEYFLSQQGSTPFARNMPDYMTGGDIFKDSNGALRNMCDPTKDGESIDHLDLYKEGMDVHYSSGIYNKVFCVLSKKRNWNAKKAFDIFVVANSAYWVANEDFISGAEKVVRAAKRVGYEINDVIDSFSKVGIELVGH